jgi:hypothetical protein
MSFGTSPVIPGLRKAKSPEPITADEARKSAPVPALSVSTCVHGFRAQACGLPRNDGGASA